LTPTYHVMEMYNVHQDALLLPLTVKSDDYEVDGAKLPAISASASKDKNGAVHISLVNIDASKSKEISIALDNIAGSSVSGRILKGESLQAHNTFAQPNKIKPEAFIGAALSGKTLKVTLPPFSVVVLQVK
ncbi:MAG TPA: alpha-L-arabinofuranosidase C-terminal domain-containing protein, partial [Flavisolibacter sp.]